MSDHLVSEAIYLSDPDGLGIEVYADRPRSALAAGWAANSSWRPIRSMWTTCSGWPATNAGPACPPGTVIGHVHLFVDDLGRAERFYHVGLGLDKMVWSYPGALFMSAGGYHHHLGTNTWAAGAPPAGPDDARLLEWEIVLPSAEQATAALASVAGTGAAVESSDGEGTARAIPGEQWFASAEGRELAARAQTSRMALPLASCRSGCLAGWFGPSSQSKSQVRARSNPRCRRADVGRSRWLPGGGSPRCRSRLMVLRQECPASHVLTT